MKTLRISSFLLALVMLFTSCASTTMIYTEPPGADVYVNYEYQGKSPVEYTSTNLSFTKENVRITKDGYKDFETDIVRDEELDLMALVGALLVYVPALWILKYKPERTFKLEKSTDTPPQEVTQEQVQPENEETKYRGTGNPLQGTNVAKSTALNLGDYYALIIGIDKYSGHWTPLDNAVNDARAVEWVLSSSYKFDHFKTLYNEKATRENILREMEWLVNNVKEKDNVFIYFSGHGQYKEKLDKGYWIPADATTNSISEFISNSDIQTVLGGIKSKHTLLVSDACFSGDIFRGNTLSVPFENSERYYVEVHNKASRQVLTSGGVEPVMDGGKDGHSVFAYYLLKVLQENKSQFFDASQLYSEIKIPVVNNSEQTPKLAPIHKTGDEGGQFIFIRR